MRKAINLYEGFHSYSPKDVGQFRKAFYIPTEATLVGDASYVLYDSMKVDPGSGVKPKRPVGYIHKHDPGVKCYRTDRNAKGQERRVPKRIHQCSELVLLGTCPGFAYIDHYGDEIEAHTEKPRPELYSTPDGRALLIIADKRTVLALIWGGKLGVEPRGIVH